MKPASMQRVWRLRGLCDTGLSELSQDQRPASDYQTMLPGMRLLEETKWQQRKKHFIKNRAVHGIIQHTVTPANIRLLQIR